MNLFLELLQEPFLHEGHGSRNAVLRSVVRASPGTAAARPLRVK
jgi:hypothetical protein